MKKSLFWFWIMIDVLLAKMKTNDSVNRWQQSTSCKKEATVATLCTQAEVDQQMLRFFSLFVPN